MRGENFNGNRRTDGCRFYIDYFNIGGDFYTNNSPPARANGTKLRARFGIVSYTFSERKDKKNMDETNPHMHLNLIPVLNGRLCSKQLFDRKALRELQSDFHEKVGEKWGLKRGKIGSTAEHLETAEFKAKKIIEGAEQQANETKKQVRQQAEDYLQGIHSAIEAESKTI